jgi:hypothetical protein
MLIFNKIKKRDMKKEAKVEYGIAIVKPWSREMYDHNDLVADIVRNEIESRWIAAMTEFRTEYDHHDQMLEAEWSEASMELHRIQRAVTCYGFGYGYDVNQVIDKVFSELEEAPYFRLKEMAEELCIELDKGFVGFN